MTKIDLITGFLGSGKTTFIKEYARYLISKGESIGILENDYGAVNVDMMLLEELAGENCELEMVSATCHMDCHKRRFKSKLISMGMCGYTRVIVEPSGIFDIDEFFDVLREDPIDRMYEIGNVITIVDARLEENLSKTSEFYLASQIANSKAIIFSRTQLVNEQKLTDVKAYLHRAAEHFKLEKDIDSIAVTKDWSAFTEADFESIRNCGYEICSYVKDTGDEKAFSSVYLLELSKPLEFVKLRVKTIFNNNECGDVFRIKGFVFENDTWYEINATKRDFDVKKIKNGQDVIIVIGECLNQNLIESILKNGD